ncbi:MAG: mannitol dehydrogenase family protein [Erysipelotrichaceae bacterium]
MRLTRNISDLKEHSNFKLPKYDVEKVTNETIACPNWLHFGAGNIFRSYIGEICDSLLDQNLATKGIIAIEGFDEEIIDKVYDKFEGMAVSSTLRSNGDITHHVQASICKGLKLSKDLEKIKKYFLQENLQIISLTITEKGYLITEDNIEAENNVMVIITKLLYQRYKNNQAPITMLSLDNCTKNGELLKKNIMKVATRLYEINIVEYNFIEYIKTRVAFPISMIDKITPQPSKRVALELEKKGFEGMEILKTSKQTYIAPFVNSEETEYLVVEDNFVNGRPQFEKAGVYITSYNQVNAIEKMKVSACLNPLHTTLAILGCLLNYSNISDEMKDKELKKIISILGYDEGLKVVEKDLIINPKKFIDNVINVRLTNENIGDTPQRIAKDTSLKLNVRFGETIKSYVKSEDLDVNELEVIPLVIALWIRYLNGRDDLNNLIDRSPDPILGKYPLIENAKIGDKPDIKPLLNEVFDFDIYSIMGEKIEEKYYELLMSNGKVRELIKQVKGKEYYE